MPPPSSGSVEFRLAEAPAEIAAIRALFIEYQASIEVDLCFQGFDDELADLPGEYLGPMGALLIAIVDSEPAGCCGFRPMLTSDHLNACEMKRLFVRPAFRRLGLGRQLVDNAITQAQMAGYATMLLDTLSDMETARTLYQDAGFVEIAPYYHNPIPGAHYLLADLTRRSAS